MDLLKDKPARERFALYGLAGFAIAAGAFAFVKGQRQPTPIVFESTPAAVNKPAEDPKSQPTQIVVHAAGAVKKPGVLRLTSDARVQDAVDAAGGVTAEADIEQVNLAAKLVDGTQVFVPRKGKTEEVAEIYGGGAVSEHYAKAPPASRSSHRRLEKKPSGPVSLNTAGKSQLETLPGIGPATAQRILEYRKGHGSFNSVDELMAVKGIGPKKLSALRKYLKL